MKTLWQSIGALLPWIIVGFTALLSFVHGSCKPNSRIGAQIGLVGVGLAAAASTMPKPFHASPLFVADSLFQFYERLVLGSVFVVLLLQFFRCTRLEQTHCTEWSLLTLLASFGGVLLSGANHLVSIFLGMELTLFPLFGMTVLCLPTKRMVQAGAKYIFASVFFTALWVFGAALVNLRTGSMSLDVLSKWNDAHRTTCPVYAAGCVLITVGFVFKMAFVPLHFWIDAVYRNTPPLVLSLLSVVGKTAVLASSIRMLRCLPVHDRRFRTVLQAVLVSSMLWGDWSARKQTNVQVLLGYSSVAHFAQLLWGSLLVRTHRFASESVHACTINHSLVSLGLFGVLDAVLSSNEEVDYSLSRLRGLQQSNPTAAWMLMVLMCSLSGMPATWGFVGKMHFLATSVAQRTRWTTLFLCFHSVLGALYCLRVVDVLCSPSCVARNFEPSARRSALRVVGALIVLLVCFGAYPPPLVAYAQRVGF